MALNKLMHPRNPYRERKPKFKELAEKYEEFRKHATKSENGDYHIDFKKPECLRALTWSLLKSDFDLDVLMPLDRLIPTIPLRLNYILWLEDVINKTKGVRGIDIGCGASCVYGLLGAKTKSWNFLSTEADATNSEYAKKNVATNNLSDKITVVKVDESVIMYDHLSSSTDVYDFCMCNPPFYGSNFEAWGMLTSRSDDRAEPSSVSTASPAESITAGGEVEFVKRMVADSVLLKDRVRVYTSMFGKKSSLPVIKQELLNNGITNIGQTEFCQGKTMRWGIGWSFDESVVFPRPPSKVAKSGKARPPLVYQIPNKGEILKGIEFTLDDIADKVETYLTELEILCECTNHTPSEKTFLVKAVKNTWSHQRRKRRKQKHVTIDDVPSTQGTEPSTGEPPVPGVDTSVTCDSSTSVVPEIPAATEGVVSEQEKIDGTTDQDQTGPEPNSPQKSPHKRSHESTEDQDHSPTEEDPLFTGLLSIKELGHLNIQLELSWQQGRDKEALHQVLQYLKNKMH